MIRNVNVRCCVYGGTDGTAAFLDVPDGVIPPPYIAHMSYLGAPYDVITGVVNRLYAIHKASGRRPRPQQALAETLGTSQQDVSRWINAQCAPRLTDEQWATLIRLALR